MSRPWRRERGHSTVASRRKQERREKRGGVADVDSTTRVLFFNSILLSFDSSPPLLPLEVLDAGLLERPPDVPMPARGEQGVAAVVRVQGDRGEVESLHHFGHRKTCFLPFFFFPLGSLVRPLRCAQRRVRGEASLDRAAAAESQIKGESWAVGERRVVASNEER